MQRKIFHTGFGVDYATGGIDEAHIGWVVDMAWESTRDSSGVHHGPGGDDRGDSRAQWNNSVTRAVVDEEIAVGLYVGPTGTVPKDPSGAVIGRRQPGSGANFVVLYAASNFDSENTLPGLLERARECAAEKGGMLVKRIDIPARVEFRAYTIDPQPTGGGGPQEPL